MNIKYIDTFLLACEYNSFSKAADAQYLSQSAVSQQIRALESELGFSLFERRSKRIALTPEGIRFRDRIRAIRDLYNNAVEDARSASRGTTQHISLGFGCSYADAWLPETVRRYEQSQSIYRIHLYQEKTSELPRKLFRGEIDAFVIQYEDIRTYGKLNLIPLFQTKCLLFMRKDHPLAQKESVSLSDIAQERLLLIDDPAHRHQIHPLILALISRGLKWRESISYDTGEIAYLACRAGKGIFIGMEAERLYAEYLGLTAVPIDELADEKTFVGLAYSHQPLHESLDALAKCARSVLQEVNIDVIATS